MVQQTEYTTISITRKSHKELKRRKVHPSQRISEVVEELLKQNPQEAS